MTSRKYLNWAKKIGFLLFQKSSPILFFSYFLICSCSIIFLSVPVLLFSDLFLLYYFLYSYFNSNSYVFFSSSLIFLKFLCVPLLLFSFLFSLFIFSSFHLWSPFLFLLLSSSFTFFILIFISIIISNIFHHSFFWISYPILLS